MFNHLSILKNLGRQLCTSSFPILGAKRPVELKVDSTTEALAVICFLSLNYSLSLILIIQKESLFLFLRTWLYYFWAKQLLLLSPTDISAIGSWHWELSRVTNISFLIFSSLTFDIHFVETHLIEDTVPSRPSVLSIASGCHLWPLSPLTMIFNFVLFVQTNSFCKKYFLFNFMNATNTFAAAAFLLPFLKPSEFLHSLMWNSFMYNVPFILWSLLFLLSKNFTCSL